MNYGPLIFLAAFMALAGSWFGLVLKPQVQLGWLQPTNATVGTVSYPAARPGDAQQGLQVYRANGCAYCHTQQATQTGTVFEALLTDAGTNQSAVVSTLERTATNSTTSSIEEMLSALPRTVLRSPERRMVDALVKALSDSGAKATLQIRPIGPDIERGWGKRRSIAEDFLYDYPVLPGSQRIGPDLANVGARLPDPAWQLRHLYAPTAEVPGSTMPPYRYLFEERRVQRVPSTNALSLKGEFAPASGYEIVPKPEATMLVAYLLSLRANTPLFSTPMTVHVSPKPNPNGVLQAAMPSDMRLAPESLSPAEAGLVDIHGPNIPLVTAITSSRTEPAASGSSRSDD